MRHSIDYKQSGVVQMVLKKCVGRKILGCLTNKICGIAVFSFCVGAIAGLCFPIAFIAILEAIMLLVLAWLCLFFW